MSWSPPQQRRVQWRSASRGVLATAVVGILFLLFSTMALLLGRSAWRQRGTSAGETAQASETLLLGGVVLLVAINMFGQTAVLLWARSAIRAAWRPKVGARRVALTCLWMTVVLALAVLGSMIYPGILLDGSVMPIGLMFALLCTWFSVLMHRTVIDFP